MATLKAPCAVHLIQAAAAAGGFDTFIAVVERAGMAATLKGAGRYTIFAPTDEAFAKLPAARFEKLMGEGHADLLKSIVRAHLVSGQLLTQRLQGRRIRGKSVGGEDLLISGDDAITINGALLVHPDIVAGNGVLHGIDKVLWPKRALREGEAALGG